METIMIAMFIIMIILLVIIIGLVIKNNNSKKSDEEFRKIQLQLNEQLLTFQNSITGGVRKDLNTLNENTNNHMIMMQKNVNDSLSRGFKTTSEAFDQVLEQVTRVDKSQEQLKILNEDIKKLNNVLNDKKNRGTFGEIELYSLLDNAFGDNPSLYQRQYKFENGSQVDAVIFGNSALGILPIDSKFPLENYNRIIESKNKDEENRNINEFKKNVKKHIDDINQKYLIPGVTSEFAYMFIPAEAIFSYIYSYCEDLVKYSYQKKVYLISPTTLMAYITAVKALYLDQKKNEQFVEIQKALIGLGEEFKRFEERYTSVKNDFKKTDNDMEKVLITANKLNKKFSDIEQANFEKKD